MSHLHVERNRTQQAVYAQKEKEKESNERYKKRSQESEVENKPQAWSKI